MSTNLDLNDVFPDFELPDQDGRSRRLSGYTRPGILDEYLDFKDGYPLIVSFYRGFFCPRDQQFMRLLVEFQDELAVNYGRLVVVAVQPPPVQAAFRAGLGAKFPFLCDVERAVIRHLNILDETEGEYADTAQPYTFVLRPDMTIYRLYDGWFFVGRPTLEELRHDLRAIMARLSFYPYEAWNTPAVKRVRIPQREWVGGAPDLLHSDLPVATGTVVMFDVSSGSGFIQMDTSGERVFFNFTAIPGEGYRTLQPETHVQFEVVETPRGRIARNIQLVSL